MAAAKTSQAPNDVHSDKGRVRSAHAARTRDASENSNIATALSSLNKWSIPSRHPHTCPQFLWIPTLPHKEGIPYRPNALLQAEQAVVHRQFTGSQKSAARPRRRDTRKVFGSSLRDKAVANSTNPPAQISIREKKRAPSAKIATIAPAKTVKSRVRPNTPCPTRKMRNASTP